MQNIVFVVNEEPYCLWDEDLVSRNESFLKGLDPEYFDYFAKTHISTDDEKRSSVALKIGLHHAMETLFSLLGAYVQAPRCSYAWLAKCQTNNLRGVVSKINDGDSSLFRVINVDAISWESVARCIFSAYMPSTDRQEETIEEFSKLWRRLAHEYLDPDHIDEYNSLKHGFRVGVGGFSLAFAEDPADGTPPPDENYKMLGRSDYGSAYFKIEPLTSNAGERSLIVSRHMNNWSIERVILISQLVYMSIKNVVSALRIGNGFPPGECIFVRPEKKDDFLRPWNYSTGVNSMKLRFGGELSNFVSFNKKEINDFIERQS